MMKLTNKTLAEGLTYLQDNQQNFPFAFVTRLSSVSLGTTQLPLDTADILEARFFGEQAELRFFEGDEGLAVALFEREETDKVIEKRSPVLPKLGQNTKLRSRQYIAFDEDGQAYTQSVCLCGLEE